MKATKLQIKKAQYDVLSRAKLIAKKAQKGQDYSKERLKLDIARDKLERLKETRSLKTAVKKTTLKTYSILSRPKSVIRGRRLFKSTKRAVRNIRPYTGQISGAQYNQESGVGYNAQWDFKRGF